MQPYTGFAAVYDMFMDNVPYEEWAVYVKKILTKYGIEQGLVLELGCGTGSMARQLAAGGYDMIGIDNSEEMLQIARDKSGKGNEKILYLCQDMREFELFGTVAAVVSVCDSMNYILSEEDLLQVFKLVNNYLDPNGLFIFDLDTQYAYEEVLGDTTIAENRSEGSFIWENTYYEDEQMNEINLSLFIPEQAEAEGDSERASRAKLFRRYEETHYRRAYYLKTVKQLIEEAGMEWIAVYEALTEKKPKKDSERVYIIAREKRQKNKLYIEA
jgi:SAM-dependent methyltransferase